MQFSKSIMFAAVALIAPLAMNAGSITSTGSLSLGDLSFSNFTCSVSSPGGSNTTPNTCGQINVATITTPMSGLQFSSDFYADGGKGEDALLGYTVTSTSGIKTIGLSFTPAFAGYAVDSVTETVYAAGNINPIASLTLICSAASNPCNSSQQIALDGSYTSLSVTKDIQLNSNPGATQFSYVDQTFTEGPGTQGASTPEPASLALVGAGLFVSGAIRRRMVKA